MKFTIPAPAFLTAIKRAKGAISSSLNLPSASCLMLEVGDGRVKVSGSNLDTVISSTADCEVIEGGSILVNNQKLFSIVSEMGESEITVAADDRSVSITRGRDFFKLMALPIVEFPAKPEIGNHFASFTIEQKVLRNAFALVAPFMCERSAARPAVTSTLIRGENNETRVVALNGRILRYTTLPNIDFEGDANIPDTAAKQILGLLEESDHVEVKISDSAISLDAGDWSIVATLLADIFPKYAPGIPDYDASTPTMTGARVDILEAIRKAEITATDGSTDPFLQIDMDVDHAWMSSQVKAGDQTRIPIEGWTSTVPITCMFNCTYLKKIVQSFKTDTISMQLGSMQNLKVEDATGAAAATPIRREPINPEQ